MRSFLSRSAFLAGLALAAAPAGALEPDLMDGFAYPPGTAAYSEIHGGPSAKPFLDAYDAAMAAAQDAAGRRAAQIAILDETRAHPIELYRELRTYRPVFVLADVDYVLVTRDRDVRRVLDNPTAFTVFDYADRMEPVVGGYMLNRDSHPYYNIEEKPWMRSLMLREDLPRIRAMVRAATERSIAGYTIDGRLDVVAGVSRNVPVTVVQEYFGFRAPTPDMLRWSFITQDSFFHNVPYLRGVRGFAVRVLGLAGPTLQAQQKEALLVQERGAAAGEEMRDFLDAYIAGHRAEILAEDTVLSRMLRVNDTLAHPKEMARIRANVMGGLIGAVETSNAAIVQSLHQLLRRPEELARARAAAAKIGPDDAVERSELAGYVWEALRFHPINPFVVRYATADAVLGDGATSAKVKKGQRVLTATFSAMHDPRTVEAPDEFRPVRPPRDREMELGYGMHRCLGDRIAEVMVPEVLRQLVLLPDLAWVAPDPALPYDEGIDMGPRRAFPERYVVRYAAPRPISAARAAASAR